MADVFVARTGEMQDGDRRIVTDGAIEVGVFRERGPWW